MKRLFLIIVLAVLAIGAKAQAVSDMAVIPIGVTLNSIARLTVTSGGNIEFVVNTMDQYQDGVEATTATTTTFSVASSTQFGVTLQADNPELKPTTHAYTAATTDASSNGMPVQVIEYQPQTTSSTSGTNADGSALKLARDTKTQLTINPEYIIKDHIAGNYQGIQIKWSLATASAKGTLTKYPSDRYVVNAFLQLVH